MNWIPRNKRTGLDYDPVTDAEKTAMEADPQTKGKYTFRADGSTVSKIAAKAKSREEKLMPVGVDPIEIQQTEKKQA